MDITEDVIKPYTQNLLESLGPGGTHLESLQELLLKRGEDNKRICTSVEFFVDWLANQRPPWEAYRAFMSGSVILIGKQTQSALGKLGDAFFKLCYEGHRTQSHQYMSR